MPTPFSSIILFLSALFHSPSKTSNQEICSPLTHHANFVFSIQNHYKWALASLNHSFSRPKPQNPTNDPNFSPTRGGGGGVVKKSCNLKKRKKGKQKKRLKKRDKSRKIFKFVLFLLSASVERVGVSRMRDFQLTY